MEPVRVYRKPSVYSTSYQDEIASPPVYWRYENPEGKTEDVIENLLNKISDDIKSYYKKQHDIPKETIGYTEETPYIITDELYKKEEITQKEEKRRKEEEIKAEKQKTHDENLKIVRETGKKYFKFINKMYDDLYNQKPEEIGMFYYYLYSRSQVKPIIEDDYMYYTISRRQIINGELKPCKDEDFVFTEKYWKQLKQKFGKARHPGIPDMFEKIEEAVENELECLKNRFSNFKFFSTSKVTPTLAPTAGPPAGSLFAKFFGTKKGGRTKKRNSNRKKTKRAKRSKK